MQQTAYDNLLAADGYESVEAFDRSALFVTKANHVHVLDVASTGPADEVFTISENRADAAEIAPLHQGEQFVVNRETDLFLLESDGTVVEEFDIDELAPDRPQAREAPPFDLPPEEINWRVETSEDDLFVYFTWLLNDGSGKWVGRLELSNGHVDWCRIEVGTGTAFDTVAGRVYEPRASDDRGVHVSSFDAEEAKFWPHRLAFEYLSISPDRRHLLASNDLYDASEQPLVVFDVDTAEARELDIVGMNATWANDGRIWFHDANAGLCVAEGPDAEPAQIFGCRSIAPENRWAWFVPPVVSYGGSWVAWVFQDSDGNPRQVLLDVETQAYRVLDQCRYGCAWLC